MTKPDLPLATRALLTTGLLQTQIAQLAEITVSLRQYKAFLAYYQAPGRAPRLDTQDMLNILIRQLDEVTGSLLDAQGRILDMQAK